MWSGYDEPQRRGHDLELHGRHSANVSVRFERHRVLHQERLDARDGSLRDRDFRIIDVTARVYARKLGDNVCACQTGSSDHIQHAIIDARLGRKHHPASRVKSISHCSEIHRPIDHRAPIHADTHAPLAPRRQSSHSRKHKTKLTGKVAHKPALRRNTTRRFTSNTHRRSIETDKRLLEPVATTVQNIDLPRRILMSNDCIDPLLERRATAMQPTSEIVARAGRKNRKRCGRIDCFWKDVGVVVELEEAFGSFAERAVTTNDDDSPGAGSQRRTRLDRRVARRFSLVCLIFNAGSVELFFDLRPNTPRLSRGVIDDYESFDLN